MENEIENLETQIAYYATKYYDGQPEISDDAFDAMTLFGDGFYQRQHSRFDLFFCQTADLFIQHSFDVRHGDFPLFFFRVNI